VVAARLPRWNALRLSTLVLGIALVTWLVAALRMRGMDMGPGSDLGAFGWYISIWVTMMAAMMLPSALPMVLLFDRVSRERSKRGQASVSTWLFVASYLAVWTLYGLVAYGLYRGIAGLHLGFVAWSRGGPYIAGALVASAGLYELTPLKSACLRQCRSPMHYVLGGWLPGRRGAIRMGMGHGASCVGCCAGLMLILFALGAMSLFWMAALAILIFVEKVLPFGAALSRTVAICIVALGVWVALAPGSVTGL